jgi:hypothetical protein
MSNGFSVAYKVSLRLGKGLNLNLLVYATPAFGEKERAAYCGPFPDGFVFGALAPRRTTSGVLVRIEDGSAAAEGLLTQAVQLCYNLFSRFVSSLSWDISY